MNEAEEACIACALVHPVAAARVVASLRPEHYTDPRLAAMHWAIARLVGEGQDVSRAAVRKLALARGSALTTGDIGAVGSGALPMVEDVNAYIRLVQEAHTRRIVSAEVAHMARDLADPSNDHRLVEIMERGSALLTREAAALAPQAEPEDLHTEIARIEWERDNPGNAPRWGYAALRQALRPLRKGQFVVVGAGTSVGKTTFMAYNAIQQARSGRRVLWISMEMPRRSMLASFMRADIGIDPQSESHERTFAPPGASAAWADTFRGLPLEIRCDLRNLPAIESCIRLAAMRAEPPEIVYVDYIQRIPVPGKDGTPKVDAVTASLKSLALDVGVPLVSGSQFNRSATMAPNVEPELSQFRDSSGIENDADTALIIWRPTTGSHAGIDHDLSCRIAKHREGRTGEVVPLHWHSSTGTIADAGLLETRRGWNQHQHGPHDWPERVAALRIPGAGG